MRVEVEDRHGAAKVDLTQLAAWAEQALALEGLPTRTELALTLVTDEEMAKLHATALNKKGPTDVLSFPIEDLDPNDMGELGEEGPPLLIGDVVIAPDYVRRQAEELSVPPDAELALMVTHGVLHCLGYDHGDDVQAEIMEDRERFILGQFGFERR